MTKAKLPKIKSANDLFKEIFDRFGALTGSEPLKVQTSAIDNLNNLLNLIPVAPTKIPHANGGCINCGKPRWSIVEIARGLNPSSRNIMVKNDKAGDIILGLCKECFERVDAPIDLEHLKTEVVRQEEEFAKATNSDGKLVEKLKSMKFLSAYRKVS